MSPLLLAMLCGILRRDIWLLNRAALLSDVVTNADVRVLVKYISELHDTYDRDLTPDDLRMLIDSKYRRPDGRKADLLEIVSWMDQDEGVEVHELQPRIADYLSRELAARAAEYIATREDTDTFDLQQPYQLLERAIEISSGLNLDVEALSEAPLPDAASERTGLFSVGLGCEMDNTLGGGVAAGEMLIWLAPPSVGKTSFLINQCVNAAKAGEHVLHVTLEISRAKVWRRVDQGLTKMTREERLGRAKEIVEARQQVAGEIYVKDWSDKNVTVDDLRTLVLSMRAQGKKVTVLSVDYLGLMAATKSKDRDPRHDFSAISRALRRLANELGVGIITAWQVNRAGSRKHVLGADDVAECWDIVMHADIILGINQGGDERTNNVIRINVIKQRESTARPVHYYYSDLDRLVIRSDGQGATDESPDDLRSGGRPRVREYRSSASAQGS